MWFNRAFTTVALNTLCDLGPVSVCLAVNGCFKFDLGALMLFVCLSFIVIIIRTLWLLLNMQTVFCMHTAFCICGSATRYFMCRYLKEAPHICTFSISVWTLWGTWCSVGGRLHLRSVLTPNLTSSEILGLMSTMKSEMFSFALKMRRSFAQ